MPFVDKITGCRSVSVIGMSKNTGKTEVLNYVLRRLGDVGYGGRIGVTSIGIDGEKSDIVTRTPKPEITLAEGTVFGTVEEFYRARRIGAEILDVGAERTPFGRVVTARARSQGKVMLAGAGSTPGIRRWIDKAESLGATLVIIDGALSRKSLASPAVSEGMVLCTGAALSADMDTLVRQTAHMVDMIRLPLAADDLRTSFANCGRGVWTAQAGCEASCLSGISSLADGAANGIREGGYGAVYAAGAVTDRFLDMFMNSAAVEKTLLVAEDFSKIFVSRLMYARFLKRGGRINVMRTAKLLALCANPVSPSGIILDSAALCARLAEATRAPVYDIMNCSGK